MTTKPYYQAKDNILQYLLRPTHKHTNTTVSTLVSALKLDPDLGDYLLDELIKEDYISARSVIGNRPGEKILIITPKGKVFITMQGGYAEVYEKEKRTKVWMVSKTIANGINAVAIITISLLSVYYSDKSNKLEAENESLKKDIEQIKNAVKPPANTSVQPIPDTIIKVAPKTLVPTK